MNIRRFYVKKRCLQNAAPKRGGIRLSTKLRFSQAESLSQKVTQTDSSYDITGTLTLKKDGSEQQADVSVSVQLNEEGRISFLRINNLSDVTTLLA